MDISGFCEGCNRLVVLLNETIVSEGLQLTGLLFGLATDTRLVRTNSSDACAILC